MDKEVETRSKFIDGIGDETDESYMLSSYSDNDDSRPSHIVNGSNTDKSGLDEDIIIESLFSTSDKIKIRNNVYNYTIAANLRSNFPPHLIV